MRSLNPFYWLRILVGELVMRTTGTWIGSHVDDQLADGSEYQNGIPANNHSNN